MIKAAKKKFNKLNNTNFFCKDITDYKLKKQI